jgi:nanoRNase/pAp phosphatase (c-di-AMP/oligoRNAs hydrolase)
VFVQSAEMYFMDPLQEFGGGGHRNASSFMISSADFEQWKVGKSASF